MTICRFAEHVSKIRGIIGRIIPSRSSAKCFKTFGNCCHKFYGGGTENAMPVKFSAVYECGAKQCNIICTGKDSCVAAYAGIYNSCQRVVNSTAQNLTCFLFFCGCYDICPRMVFFAQTGRLTVLQYPFWSSRQGM